MLKRILSLIICLITTVNYAQDDAAVGNAFNQQSNKKSLFICGSHDTRVASAKNVSPGLLYEESLGFKKLRSIRKVRIAIVATGEYSQYFIEKENAHNLPESQQKEIVLHAVQRSVLEVNKIFERDLMIEFELIEENKKLIFLDPETDDLNAASQAILVTQLTSKINSIIDENDYDIGHAFNTTYGGLSNVRGAFRGNKAQGVTGAFIPEGKLFNVDFFAHELGHQLGATHTQNSDCIRFATTSVEAGSGATIMGYAGVCNVSESNVALESLSYFHDYTILQINNYVSQFLINEEEGQDYGLNSILDYSIPLLTPFEIELDADLPIENQFFYSCNQVDAELAEFPPNTNETVGPVFTAQELSDSPVFCFPKSEAIINNNFNSKQGVLSSVPRQYNFLASVRGGGDEKKLTSSRKFKVNVIDAAPFVVTSQNEEKLNWFGGESKIITWEVGGSKSILNQNYVQILLSDNNGASFDYVLSEKTANDGTEKIKVPRNLNSNNCRVKVKPINSVFYSINKERFSISPLHEVAYSNNNTTGINTDAVSFITIDEEFEYDVFEVSVELQHENLSGMVVSVVNPEDKEVLLWDGQCSNGSTLNVRFTEGNLNNSSSESGKNHVWTCDDVVLGFTVPKQTFKSFNNKAKGAWRLKITDLAASNSEGVLTKWAVHFFAKNKPVSSLANNSSGINFYPNPIKKHMTIDDQDLQFSSGVLEVFTISGTLEKAFKFNRLFLDQFYLGDLHSGMYMLRLTSAGNSIIKKVLIE